MGNMRRAHERVAIVPGQPYLLPVTVWLPLLSGALLVLLGVGIIAWDYALHTPVPANYASFWAGIGLCLSGTVTLGLRRIALARDHILTLAVFGVALWLPYFLRSPGHLIFTDELFHYQVLQLIAESGHTHVPRLGPYPIPGEYPGLELGTLGVMAVTGLPIDIAVRLMTVAAHILIPLLVYVFARGLGLEKRRAFVAALVYMTNTSYFFFHSIFSYETLGIVLFLSLWVLLARHRRRNIGKHDLLLFMPMLFAIAVTHHISSYIFAAAVATKWLAQKVLARGARDRSGIVVAISLLFPAAWLKLRTVHTFTYLFSNMTSRFNFATTQGTSRRLFSVSSVPSLERLIDYMYAPLLPTLTLVGIFLVVRRYGWRNVPPLLLSLAIIGPLAWLLTAPVVLTPSSDVAFRSWPFLFLGLAIYGAPVIVLVTDWLRIRVHLPGCRWFTIVALIGLLFIGGISIGDNQAGRFPAPQPRYAAGPEDTTPDAISAALWLEHTAGRDHMIVGDRSTLVTFGTLGLQRTPSWGSWTPFVTPSTAQVRHYIRVSGVEYLITDQRDTWLLPRYGNYFGFPEDAMLRREGYAVGRVFPSQLLAKFNDVDTLNRVYDNGNIQIYGAQQPASSRVAH